MSEGTGFRCEGNLARMIFHVSNHGFEIGELGIGGVHHERVGVIKERHAGQLEIVQNVELFIHSEHLGDAGAAVIEHEAIAVIRVAQQVFKGNRAGSAGHVGHDHVPAHFLVKGSCKCTGIGIRISAGIGRHDQLNGALRPVSQGTDTGQNQHQHDSNSKQFLHSSYPPSIWTFIVHLTL